jgi:nucleoid-associated protein YgaU
MMATLDDGTTIAGAGTVAIAPIAARAPVATAEPAPEPVVPEPPAALLVTESGAAVIQGPAPITPGEVATLSLDAISYAPDGAVQLAGKGQGDATLRIYLDNTAKLDAAVGSDGTWAVTLPDTAPGIYTMRIDQLGADGTVTSRFETPFKRETLEALAAVAALAPAPVPERLAEPEPAPTPEPVPAPAPETAAVSEPAPAPIPAPAVTPVPEALPEPAPLVEAPAAAPVVAEPIPEPAPVPEPLPVPEPAPAVAATDPVPAQTPVPTPVATAPVTITVQPGFTLWGIANDMMGEGTMYVQVFEANKDKIRDPDLIYPGQVFTVPQE